ncbi:hypothetical protein SprV_0401720700 [Sparganum proliferum]
MITWATNRCQQLRQHRTPQVTAIRALPYPRGSRLIVQMRALSVARRSVSGGDTNIHNPADLRDSKGKDPIDYCWHKKILINQRELKAEMAALREEVRCLTASNPLPSASETPIVQRVCTLGAYDELTAEVSDTSYRRNLVAYLSAIGGETVTAFAERIFFTLFSEDVAEFLTFYGRKAGTRGLFDSPVYSVILEVFNRWNKDHHSDRQQLENAFKNAFKKGHDRYQRKCHRASQSRQSNGTF